MKNAIELARELRRNQTAEEKLMWGRLRNRKLGGFKFLRQHPIYYATFTNEANFFIVDFYCHEKKLAIEIDGRYHDFQQDMDINREKLLTEMGIQVLRFKNEEIQNIETVLSKIKKVLIS